VINWLQEVGGPVEPLCEVARLSVSPHEPSAGVTIEGEMRAKLVEQQTGQDTDV